MTLRELFDSFQSSAFRLETLDQYLVDQEAEEFAAWRESRPLAPATPETSPWLRRIADTTRLGKRWSRVHLVDLPLSEYLRFEFDGQAASVKAGEDVRVALRSAAPPLADLRQDFWVFDDATAALMRYDSEGRWLGVDVTADHQVVRRCREQRDLALAHSVPLAEFQAKQAA